MLLPDPPLEVWATMAMKHWKEWQPKRYRRLIAAGDLEQEAMAAAKLTWGEMKVWLMQGATWEEAWEACRELFILRPTEADEK